MTRVNSIGFLDLHGRYGSSAWPLGQGVEAGAGSWEKGRSVVEAPRSPLSTDEWPDRLWSRPVARILVKGMLRTPLTANQATALAAACGVAAGVALALGQGVFVAAALALCLALDCADGQLARAGRGGGVLGRLADGIGDYVTAVSVHVGWIVWMARSHDLVESVLWGVGAGASMAWSS